MFIFYITSTLWLPSIQWESGKIEKHSAEAIFPGHKKNIPSASGQKHLRRCGERADGKGDEVWVEIVIE